MRIDLGGGNIQVAEQLLNASQIGIILDEVCSKAMAKSMRSDWLLDSSASNVFF